MRELIYDKDSWPDILERWPEAKFTDASDFIHESRYEVEIEGVTDDEFYPFIIEKGWAGACFGLQLMLHDKNQIDKVLRWMREAGIEIEVPS